MRGPISVSEYQQRDRRELPVEEQHQHDAAIIRGTAARRCWQNS